MSVHTKAGYAETYKRISDAITR
jgi:hypothetical protein